MSDGVDIRVGRLKTVEDCEMFEKNMLERGEFALAKAARRREIQLRSLSYAGASDAERECLQAVYAYERVLRSRNGKRVRASRTWMMIKQHGIIGAVERAVNRPNTTVGFSALIEMGLEEFAFEAVVARYPDLFSEAAVGKSVERLRALRGAHK